MRVTVLALALVASCVSACSTGIDGTPRPTPPPAAAPSQVPGQVLDLSNWNLTLPTGSPGKPDTVQQPALATYSSPFFQVDAGRGPVFIEAKCRRMRAHSTDDDDRAYRPPEEIAESRALDPVEGFASRLIAEGVIDADELAAMKREITQEINRATDEAEAEAYPGAEELFLNVVEGPWQPWQ